MVTEPCSAEAAWCLVAGSRIYGRGAGPLAIACFVTEQDHGPQKPARPPQSTGQSQRLPTMFNDMFQQVKKLIRTLACDDANRSESSSCTSIYSLWIGADLLGYHRGLLCARTEPA